MCLYKVNLELWLENKSKLAIQMAYNVVGVVQVFISLEFRSSWKQDDNEQYTPYVGDSMCSSSHFSRNLEENMTLF